MTTKGCISYTVINGTIQLFMARSTIPIVSPASGEIHLQIFQQRLPPTSPPLIWSCHDEISQSSVAYEGDTPWKASFLTRNSKREEKHRSAVLRRPVSLGLPHCCKKKHELEIRSLIGLPVKCGFPDDFQFLFSSIKETHQTYSQFSSIVGFRIG